MVDHPTHNCCYSVFFLDKNCFYLDAEHVYDHINQETISDASATSANQTCVETVQVRR